MVVDHGHSDSVPVGPISKIPQACTENGPAVPDLEQSADNQAGQTIHQLTFPYISAPHVREVRGTSHDERGAVAAAQQTQHLITV